MRFNRLVEIAKKSGTRLLSLSGIGHYRLDAPSYSYKSVLIPSPIYHNTRERLDRFWADPVAVGSYLSPKRMAFYREVVQLSGERDVEYDGKSVVDVGCGTGHLLRQISDNFAPKSLTGFDFSKEALTIAGNLLPGVDLRCCDVYELPNIKCDIVFCLQVLEHLLFPDEALRNLMGVLDKSGIALITVPNGRTDTYRGHINFWSPDSWPIFVKGVCSGLHVETGLLTSNGANYAIVRQDRRDCETGGPR